MPANAAAQGTGAGTELERPPVTPESALSPTCARAPLACLAHRVDRRVQTGQGCARRTALDAAYEELVRTLADLSHTRPELFSDRKAMFAEQILLARTYLDTVKANAARRLLPEAWRTSFLAAHAGDVGTRALVLLGFNALFQEDLPFVLATVGNRVPEALRDDGPGGFARVLAAAGPPIIDAISRGSDPDLTATPEHWSPIDRFYGLDLLQTWRRTAASFAARLGRARTDDEREEVAQAIHANASAWAAVLATPVEDGAAACAPHPPTGPALLVAQRDPFVRAGAAAAAEPSAARIDTPRVVLLVLAGFALLGTLLASRRAGRAPLAVVVVLVAVEGLLVASGRLLAAEIADAAVALVLLNIGGRSPSVNALRALALVPIARVAALGMPFHELSRPVGDLLVAVPLGIAAVWLAPAVGVSARSLATVRAPRIQLATAAAGVPLGLLLYLAGAPRLWDPDDGGGLVVLAVLAATMVAVVEELVFRGLVQITLQRAAGASGVLAAVGLFTASYLDAGSAQLILVVALAGLVFARTVLRTGSLAGAIGGHVFLALSAGALWPAVLGADQGAGLQGPAQTAVLVVAVVLAAVGAAAARPLAPAEDPRQGV